MIILEKTGPENYELHQDCGEFFHTEAKCLIDHMLFLQNSVIYKSEPVIPENRPLEIKANDAIELNRGEGMDHEKYLRRLN